MARATEKVTFEVYKDVDGQWRSRLLRPAFGKLHIVSDGGEAVHNKKDMLDTTNNIIKAIQKGNVVIKVTVCLLLAFLCVGCSTIVGTRTAKGDITLTSHRFFWASEGIEFSLCESNKMTSTLKVQKSSTDSTAIANVFTGLQGIGVSVAK